MASITIRNLEDDIKQRLRVRAAEHGQSMEEEARLSAQEGARIYFIEFTDLNPSA